MRPPHVVGDARGAQGRPAEAHPQRRLAVDAAQPARPADEDLVAVDERHAVFEVAQGVAHPVAQAAHELVVQVAVDAADAHVVEEQPLAGQGGQHLDDLVALEEAVQDRRDAAQVQGQPAHEQGVAGDAVQLAGQDADVVGPPRHGHVEQLLGGQHRHVLAEHRGDVLERVAVADDHVPVAVLADLLHAAVEVAQHGVQVDDPLAVDLEDDAQHAVRRGMLRADVDEHLAFAQGVELGLALGARRVGRDGVVDGGRRVDEDRRIVERADLRLGRGHGVASRAWRRSAGVPVSTAGSGAASMGRTPSPGERLASSGSRKSLRRGKLR